MSGQAEIKTFSDIGYQGASQFWSLMESSELVFATVGLIILGLSLHKLSKDRRSGEDTGTSILGVVMGSVLFSLGLVIMILTKSVFDDQSAVDDVEQMIYVEPGEDNTNSGSNSGDNGGLDDNAGQGNL